MGGDLPYPDCSARRTQPQVESTVGKGRPGISRKHKLRSCKGNPTQGTDSLAFEPFLDRLPLE